MAFSEEGAVWHLEGGLILKVKDFSEVGEGAAGKSDSSPQQEIQLNLSDQPIRGDSAEGVGSELANSIEVVVVRREEDACERAWGRSRERVEGSSQNQWPRRAGGSAHAYCNLGLRAGGGEDGGGERAGTRRRLLPSQQLPPQQRGHVVWCVGRGGGGPGGEEEEGVKPREETGERHHTHTAQDGRRSSSTSSCQAFRRGRGARRLAGTCARAARRPAGAKRPRLGRVGPRAGVGARGRGARGGRAHDAESAAAAAAAEAPRGPGGSTRYGREARAGGPARDSGAGDQEVPTAALGPADFENGCSVADEKVTYKIKIIFG
ncbi:golgin subfamily A member 6-like protein 2 [Orcinus orca]|uniref:golgin subfamily A member 6-like protein 2 n=1 Tax=Orcinus orca TaxID=9733 RepID=UPI00144165C1|nr:golgin subfamily A member 6-like protein 2 [Orcinus orca]